MLLDFFAVLFDFFGFGVYDFFAFFVFDVLSLSMGARKSPLFVAITTAGQRIDSTGSDSIAYTLYQLARRRIAGESNGEAIRYDHL